MFRYVCIIFLFVLNGTASANITVSREEYERVVDHLNCELAKFYIERNQGIYQLDAYKEMTTAVGGCSFEHLMVFIKERQPQMDNNGYLAAYIESFKPQFDSLASNAALYNKLMDIFDQDLLMDYEVDGDFGLLKTDLKALLEEDLRIHEMGTNDGEIETIEPSTPFFEQLTGWKIALILFGVFLIVFLIALVRWARKYFNTGKNQVIISEMEKKAAEKRNLIIANNTVIVPDIIEPEPKVIEPIIEPEKEEIMEESTATSAEQPSDKVFYMPYPSVDGSFYQFARHDLYQFGTSAFRFEIKIVEYNLATFELLSDTDIITDIFMDYEKTIKSVCDIEGNPKDLNKVIKAGITKIVTVEQGTVQRSSQHWRLKQKAIIRFEYE